jgi:hypothetical protein
MSEVAKKAEEIYIVTGLYDDGRVQVRLDTDESSPKFPVDENAIELPVGSKVLLDNEKKKVIDRLSTPYNAIM